MMQTRCSNCATIFRVTPEQLKAKHGKVRCGHCQHIFNALDRLIETLPPEPAVAAENSLVIDDAARSFDDSAEKTSGDTSILVDMGVESPAPPDEFTVESTTESIEPSAEHLPEQVLAATPPQPEKKALAEPAWLAQDSDLLLDDDDVASTARAWPWALVSLLALLLLLVQGLVQFRVEMTVLLPASKPALQVLCGYLGCDLPLPQKAGLLGIEASDLHPDPQHKGHLMLNATLKNRAPFVQAYPDIELTLTDTADQPLLRKVLASAEYLPRNADAAGFAANSELVLNLSLTPDGNPNATAAGYRLYLFYP